MHRGKVAQIFWLSIMRPRQDLVHSHAGRTMAGGLAGALSLRGWLFFPVSFFSKTQKGGRQCSLHAPPKVDLGLFVLVLGLWRLVPLQQLQQGVVAQTCHLTNQINSLFFLPTRTQPPSTQQASRHPMPLNTPWRPGAVRECQCGMVANFHVSAPSTSPPRHPLIFRGQSCPDYDSTQPTKTSPHTHPPLHANTGKDSVFVCPTPAASHSAKLAAGHQHTHHICCLP